MWPNSLFISSRNGFTSSFGSSGAQTIDDTAILDFNLPADLFASAGRSFVSEILTTLSPAILDRLSRSNTGTMSKNERIRHQLESWKTISS